MLLFLAIALRLTLLFAIAFNYGNSWQSDNYGAIKKRSQESMYEQNKDETKRLKVITMLEE
jgi:hypothetical protein